MGQSEGLSPAPAALAVAVVFPGRWAYLSDPPPPRSVSASIFESDLRAVREGRGTSLEEIQQQTRIPVDVLRRFEEGHLLQDESYNDVYIRAFLKSYAKAVGIPQADAIAAYDASLSGRYAGQLHPEYDPGAAPPPPAAPLQPAPGVPGDAPAAPSAPNAPAAQTAPPTPPAAQTAPPTPPAQTAPPAVAALRHTPVTRTAKTTAGEPTVPKARVARPAVPGARRSFDKNWGTILGLFALVVLVLGGALWFLVFRDADTPETDTRTTTASNGTVAEIDSAGVGAGAAAGGPQLQTPLQVVVTASGDGLQSFRVTADDGDRRPYWVETGESETFTADSELTLWGEGDELSFGDATVELQGFRWQPASGTPLVISQATGQALLDSLARVPNSPSAAPGVTP